MAVSPIRIALDLSCAYDTALTGVGYTALFQFRALLDHLAASDAREAFDFRLFATRPRHASPTISQLGNEFSRRFVLPCARQLKYYLWSYAQWPPIEWFTGEVDIAHNLFHQLPATRKACRLVTIHDLSFFRVPETHTRKTVQLQKILITQCARQAGLCIAVSQSCKRDLVELLGMDEDRIRVVPGGVNLREFDDEPKPALLEAIKKRFGINRPYFMHLGTIEPRKNLPRLLKAYRRFREHARGRGPASGRHYPQLVLVGKPGWLYEPAFRAMKELNLEGDVIHCGYIPRNEAFLLLKNALACVYPSLYEGFGLPVLEAMAARVPVITSNVASLPEVVGDTGTLVNPTDIDEIEAALQLACERTEDDMTRARVEAAYRRAQEFTWERSAQALAGVYREIAAR